MKKYLIFFILICATLAQARSTVVVVGGGAPVECTTSSDSTQFEATTTTSNLALPSDQAWKGQGFTLAGNITATEVQVYIQDAETISGAITAVIYTNSSSNPGLAVSGTSVELNSADIATGPGWVSFTFSSTVNINAGNYFVVFYSDGNQSSQAPLMYYQDGVGSNYRYSTNAGGSWSAYTATAAVRVMGCAR